MTTLAVEIDIPHAVHVMVDDNTLTVDLDDGRTVSVPVAWYPRLFYASKNEREKLEILFKDIKENDEYEIMFFNKNITLENFLNFYGTIKVNREQQLIAIIKNKNEEYDEI